MTTEPPEPMNSIGKNDTLALLDGSKPTKLGHLINKKVTSNDLQVRSQMRRCFGDYAGYLDLLIDSITESDYDIILLRNRITKSTNKLSHCIAHKYGNEHVSKMQHLFADLNESIYQNVMSILSAKTSHMFDERAMRAASDKIAMQLSIYEPKNLQYAAIQPEFMLFIEQLKYLIEQRTKMQFNARIQYRDKLMDQAMRLADILAFANVASNTDYKYWND